MDKYAFHDPLVRGLIGKLEKSRRVLFQLPTAGGKTRVARRVAGGYLGVIGRYREKRYRVWFMVHADHLVIQASGELALADISHGVLQAGKPETPSAQVQVCSIQSMKSRWRRLPPPDLLIWDEAHHSPARSWRELMEAFPEALHLGVTATPERLDGKPLGSLWQEMVVGPQPRELEALEVLSSIRYFAPSIVDLKRLKVTGNDYDRGASEAAMRVLVGNAIDEYRAKADGRPAILFAASVRASREMVERFVAAGIPAAHVDGETPNDTRAVILARVAGGEIKIICNYGVFTEGLDVPALGAVILMRPTKSLALFLQMIGRGRRWSRAWSDLVVLDHAGAFYDHGDPNADREWSLTEAWAKRNRAAASARERRCPECAAVQFAPAPICPECSHVYTASDPSIAELHGELHLIGPAEGCETQGDFARRIGRAPGVVCYCVKHGMPADENGNPIIQDALTWCAENRRLAPGDGCETQSEFARRVGRSSSMVSGMVKRGMPTDDAGNPRIQDALQWYAENQRLGPGDGCETQSEFARRVGSSTSGVRSMIERGMPTDERGNPRIQDALAWYAEKRRRPVGDGYETATDFGRRIGRSLSAVLGMIRAGMPANGAGNPHTRDALAWFAANRRLAPSDGCETQKEFARKIGRSSGAVSVMVKTGMPADEYGNPLTLPALKWVERRNSKPSDGCETQTSFARRIGCSSGLVCTWIKRGMPADEHRNPIIADAIPWVNANTKYRCPPAATKPSRPAAQDAAAGATP